ncbi:MAG: hypothetical protein DRN71_01030 [Candidatus Nanohalarchaeota archaeon]|nr:MAG: hypothetical protein DRN71_01030 [Candidatus Nanohaloarchaeota archaeon]
MIGAEGEFRVFMEKMYQMEGLDPLSSKIIALVYISPDDVAMDEIARETGYSLASISLKVTMLAQFEIISKIRKPNSKKYYVHMEKNFINATIDQLVRKQQNQLTYAKSELPGIIEMFRERAITDDDKKKLVIVKDYQDQIMKFDSVINDIINMLRKIK